ncbi:MAG: type IV secretory system conjugative DNA transfer family protein [Candidatus Moranbacteria bacterium]|nr:type IV secretory system conjugative DNA transfer family protein [Candidatus Moranbacteria bacterium]
METSALSFDLNQIFIPVAWFFGFLALFTGVLLVIRSFFRFRAQVNQSIAMDIELVRVTKPVVPEQRSQDAWKEEVLVMEKLLEAISSFKRSVSPMKRFFYEAPTIVLEMAQPAGSEEILFFIAMPKKFRDGIEKQVNSFFSGAVLEKVSDYTIFTPGSATALSVLGLKSDPVLPLRTYNAFGTDSLDEFASAMSKLDTETEGAAIQIVLAPAQNGWRKHAKEIAQRMQQGKRLKDALKADSSAPNFFKEVGKGVGKEMVSTATGGVTDTKSDPTKPKPEDKTVSLTPEEQETLKAIETKANDPAFRANIRLLASAVTESRAEELLAQLETAFTQFDNPDVNTLQVKRRVKRKRAAFDYIFRNFDEESSMILSSEEIASMFHFPISVTETPKIKWLKSGAAAPPINVPKEGLPLGYNDYRGQRTDIRLTDDDRRRHLYVIGQTGTGKSYFIQGLAKWDARQGHGFCFIDPHGDAIEDIIASIPRERADDVIVFDPSDVERPIGLNMLEYDQKHPEQKTFVINEMIGIFDQLYDLKATGGPMFEQYIRNAMLLIMDSPETGSTLMEIPRVLADEEFRKFKLSQCKNPIVRDFWLKEAEKAGGEAALANMVPYITSKLTTFIANDIMRPIIAQQESGLDFREIMDSGKILLVNLSKGKIGEINAKLLGMVIVGKLLMAALSRVDTPEDERKDFYLYMDEFQNVTTNSIAQILSEARKYRLDLILVHQFISQLKEEISKAVFGNVGSMVALRVGPEDADFLEKQFAPVFTANDLMNVDNRQGFARLLIGGEQRKPFNMKTLPSPSGDRELAAAFKELSRLRYGRDATIVNREILDRVNQFMQVARKTDPGPPV